MVTVALPVHRDEGTLEGAFESIAGQTLAEFEVLIVLNGTDAPTRATGARLARRDPRARVIELERANLAGALNAALRVARHPLVARMDADDLCTPDRLARQTGAMGRLAGIAALGTAYDMVEASGRVVATIRPPTEPEALRWRLLLHNPLCHGSMMLRRDAVLDAGGYDESLDRAQDYDLWLRLARDARVACLPDVLYSHRLRATDAYASSPEQARVAGELIARAWGDLPGASPPEAATWLGAMLGDERGIARAREDLERDLASRPTREGLMAWLWSNWMAPGPSARAIDACRRSRLREVGARLRARGAGRVVLVGAGAHAAWVMAHRADLGLSIDSLADDACAGQSRLGMVVRDPDSLEPGEHALISSDAHEDEIARRLEPLRRRGVHVHRLYADDSPAPTDEARNAPRPHAARA